MSGREFASGPTVNYNGTWSFNDVPWEKEADGQGLGMSLMKRVDGSTGEVDFKQVTNIDTFIFRITMGDSTARQYVFHDIGFASPVNGGEPKSISRYNGSRGTALGVGFTLASALDAGDHLDVTFPTILASTFYYCFSIIDKTDRKAQPIIYDPKLYNEGAEGIFCQYYRFKRFLLAPRRHARMSLRL